MYGSPRTLFEDVTPELVRTLWNYRMLADEYDLSWYLELVPALKKRGRNDLAVALSGVLDLFRGEASGHGASKRVWLPPR